MDFVAFVTGDYGWIAVTIAMGIFCTFMSLVTWMCRNPPE
jgi:hypothetical protein